MFDGIDEGSQSQDQSNEEFEIKFNYINLESIQGGNKISLTKTIVESNDLQLFEQDLIQRIIDYKWSTYAQHFFLKNFFLYVFFFLFFCWDLQTINIEDSNGFRIKDW